MKNLKILERDGGFYEQYLVTGIHVSDGISELLMIDGIYTAYQLQSHSHTLGLAYELLPLLRN